MLLTMSKTIFSIDQSFFDAAFSSPEPLGSQGKLVVLA